MLTAVLVVSVSVAVGIGPVGISPATTARIICHHLFDWPHQAAWGVADDAIVWQIRMPRILLAVIVGAGLSIAGTALQAIVRNILAEPYLLGVSSGATADGALYVVAGFGAGLGSSSLSASAFIGALLAMVAVFFLARVGGRVTATRMLLAGVLVAYVLQSVTSVLIFTAPNPETAQSVLYWVFGTLTLARPTAIAVGAILVALCFINLIGWARRFDALAIGDETAQSLGVRPSRFHAQALVVVALYVGSVVALSGTINFVGLVIPHLARRLVGGMHARASSP